MEVFYEYSGNNKIIISKLHESTGKYKDSIKSIKSSISAHNYKEANKEIKSALKYLHDVRDEIYNINTDILDDAASVVTHAAVVKAISMAVATVVGSTGVLWTHDLDGNLKDTKLTCNPNIKTITKANDVSNTLVKLKFAGDATKAITGYEVNHYKLKAIDKIDKEIHKLDTLSRKVGAKIDHEKYTKESIDVKLNIYDSYESGLLTESEKDELLSYFEDAKVSKKKQKILDNQDFLKKNFNSISSDLKKMVLSNAGDYKLKIEEKKSFNDHEDHHEQHYLLSYSIDSKDDLSKIKAALILAGIGNKVEKEFKKSKKEFLDKGLYFDNKKKDITTRFVELHYDFY